jgi:predicted DNA-binding transcriptional regulator YafY
MLDVKASGRTFKRPRRFDLARTWADSAARFESELHKLRARIRVSPRGLKWFSNARIAVVPSAIESADQVARVEWQEVQMPIESIEQGARQVLGFGAEIEVIEPAELRAEVLRQARRLMTIHAASR